MSYKVAYPRKKRQQREYGPIPFCVSLELTFLPDGLDEGSYEEEVRKVVRKNMPEILQERQTKHGCWFEEYDDFVSRILEEEMSRN